MRRASLNETINAIKSRSSLTENRVVFENLISLRNNIANDVNNYKRDFDCALSDSNTDATDENYTSRKRAVLPKQLFSEKSTSSVDLNTKNSYRAPLLPIDLNSMTQENPKEISVHLNMTTCNTRQQKKRDRILQKKAHMKTTTLPQTL